MTSVPTIISYNEGICDSTFTSIISDREHRFNMLLEGKIGALQFPSGVPIVLEIHSLYVLLLEEQRFINYWTICWLGFKDVLCIFPFVNLASSITSL